jgi:hypothetical protein
MSACCCERKYEADELYLEKTEEPLVSDPLVEVLIAVRLFLEPASHISPGRCFEVVVMPCKLLAARGETLGRDLIPGPVGRACDSPLEYQVTVSPPVPARLG